MGAFDLLAGLTARLASTARLDEIVDAVVREIVELGFGTVWLAGLDEQTDKLSTLKAVIDGVATHEVPAFAALDMWQPLGHGLRERRMINITDPAALPIIERGDDPVPPHKLGVSRAIYDHLRGHPFACGPLLDSHRRPVGALALSAYRGNQPIPDAVFSHGLLRALMDHLGIAMERALAVVRLERLDAELRTAQETILAQARIKAVGELAEAAAHNLNNLSGVAQYAIDRALRSSADAVEMLPGIERAHRAIADLVGRFQRIARAPSSEAEAEAVDLQQIVEDVLIMATPKLRGQSIEVEADLPAVPLVLCDAVLIHQIVLNLLINAYDALGEVPAGQRRIKLGMRDGDGVVRLVVADSGPGIAPEILANMFRQPMTTKGHAHLGLGLSTAHASLQPFGGQLEGRNAPAGGAVFEVTLVVAPPGTPVAAPPHPSPAPAPAITEKPRQARILAVDDDPDIVYVIRAIVEPLGHQVVTATDPEHAIAAAASQAFDLVLCDLGMPKQSGRDVCRSLRDADYRGKLVLMTGYDTETLRTDPGECDMLLKKPFQAIDLIHLIDTLLGP